MQGATSLLIACVIPAALFSATLVVFNIATAIVAALTWALGAISWRWASSRPVSGLLLLTTSILIARSAFALATGNTFVYFIQPVFADCVVATVFLGSLWSSRPMIARLAADFYPMDDRLAARPRVRRLFWRLTLMWGLVILVKASATLWLLQTQSTVDFVLLKNSAVITITTLGGCATIWLSALVARKEDMLATK